MLIVAGILIGLLCERIGKKYGSTWLVRKMPAFLFYTLLPCLLVSIRGLRMAVGTDPTKFDEGYRIAQLATYASMVPVGVAFVIGLHSAYGVLRAKDRADHADEEAMRPKPTDLPYR